MNQFSFFKTISLILFLIPLFAFAVPISGPQRFIDNDLTTIDTVTGLEWLDVPVTAGMPYLSVEDECKPGGAFEGFRHVNVAAPFL